MWGFIFARKISVDGGLLCLKFKWRFERPTLERGIQREMDDCQRLIFFE